MNEELQELKEEVDAIKARNARVEADKDWETSTFKRISTAFLTYLVVLVFMLVTKADQPLLNSLVPALAYLLGNISIGILKSWWLKRRKI